jgi:hypothetical protein
MLIGKRTLRKSGVIGSRVAGWRTGCGGTGRSALMLYQAFGIRLSSSRNLVGLLIMCLLLWVSWGIFLKPMRDGAGEKGG